MNLFELILIVIFVLGIGLGYVGSPFIEWLIRGLDRVMNWRDKHMKKK